MDYNRRPQIKFRSKKLNDFFIWAVYNEKVMKKMLVLFFLCAALIALAGISIWRARNMLGYKRPAVPATQPPSQVRPIEVVEPTLAPPTQSPTVTKTKLPLQKSVTPTPVIVPTLTLPPQLSPNLTPVRNATAIKTYIVQAGESLVDVSVRFKVSVLSLMQANHIPDISLVAPGQVLVLPESDSGDDTQPAGSKHMIVDISDQKLYAYQGSRQVFEFVVSTGQSDGTLLGSYMILDKLPNAYSDLWKFWMPYWMGIYYVGEYLENGIHALPVLENGEQLWGEKLGTPVSYGCVVLAPADAEELYRWVEIGTPLEIRR
jgi:lipoprotein-anchoring transpeptidase ErfK/SrfK